MANGDRKVPAERLLPLDASGHHRSSPMPKEEGGAPAIVRSLTPRADGAQMARDKSGTLNSFEEGGAPAIARSLTPRSAGAQTARQNSGTLTSIHAQQDSPVRRSNRARTDTSLQGPPSRPLKDQPSRSDKKWGLVGDMPFSDLLWICEQSFRKEAATLGKEILAIARNKFTDVTDSLLHDQLFPEMAKLQQEVEAPAKVDWGPMHEEFSTQSTRFDGIERQLSEEVAFLRSEVQGLQKQQERASAGFSTQLSGVAVDLRALQEEVATRAERQAKQVFNVQQSLSADAALVSNSVKGIQQEVQGTVDELLPRIEKLVRRYIKEEPVNVSFEELFSYKARQTDAVMSKINELQSTVNTIKIELNNEFEKQVEERQRAMDSRLEEFTLASKEMAVGFNLRDTWCQTEPPPVTERSAQTEGKGLFPKKPQSREEASKPPERSETIDKETEEKKKEKEKDQKKIFTDGEAMRKRARAALIKPQYNVTNYYHATGWAQAVAKHWLFEYITMMIIFANAIWIAIDIDNNSEAVLLRAAPGFQIVEHLFCTYFTFELFVRFMAFRDKRSCLRDLWFVFDSLLVAAMIADTWILTIVFAAAGVGSSSIIDINILKILRMVRMVRLSRMAKLLRMLPELLVLLKAIHAAVRSMCIFFLLWLIVIYVFAVVFRQLTDGQQIGREFFQSVPDAMNTLLLQGVIPGSHHIMKSVTEESWIYWPIMMSFITLTSITLMYMLIGVLTEVIRLVAQTEKEGMVVSGVASRMRAALQAMGRHDGEELSKMDFQELLVQPEVAGLCQEIGVNVVVLVDMSDVIFESVEKDAKGMTFTQLVEVVLNMRGTNPATVKDVKEQLRVIKGLVYESQNFVVRKLTSSCGEITKQIVELRSTIGIDDDDDNASH